MWHLTFIQLLAAICGIVAFYCLTLKKISSLKRRFIIGGIPFVFALILVILDYRYGNPLTIIEKKTTESITPKKDSPVEKPDKPREVKPKIYKPSPREESIINPLEKDYKDKKSYNIPNIPQYSPNNPIFLNKELKIVFDSLSSAIITKDRQQVSKYFQANFKLKGSNGYLTKDDWIKTLMDGGDIKFDFKEILSHEKDGSIIVKVSIIKQGLPTDIKYRIVKQGNYWLITNQL